MCTYYDASPEGIVAQLLISDGERSRHNRKALLAAHFKCCGVAISPHPTVGAVCVMTLAGGYGPKPLDRPARVVCEAGETPSAEFFDVLRSIPYPQITEEVRGWPASGEARVMGRFHVLRRMGNERSLSGQASPGYVESTRFSEGDADAFRGPEVDGLWHVLL